jgi:HSP20 family protein
MLTPIVRPILRDDPLASFSRDLDRLFNGYAPDAGGQRRSAVPAMNVWHDDDKAVAEVDLPGFSSDNLEIHVHESTLTVSGRRDVDVPNDSQALHVERASGSFSRSVTLPFPIDADKVEASLDAGVLRITLPQVETAKPRRIAVGAASSSKQVDVASETPQDAN